MKRVDVDLLADAVRSHDLALAKASLDATGQDRSCPLAEAVLCQALAAELSAAAERLPKVLIMALYALCRDDGRLADTPASLEDLEPLMTGDSETFATRWIAAFAQERADSAVNERPPVRRFENIAFTPGLQVPQRRHNAVSDAIHEALLALGDELSEWLYQRRAITASAIAALQCSAWTISRHGGLAGYMLFVDTIRRLYQDGSDPGTTATLLLLLVLENRERGILSDTGEWAKVALRLASPHSREATLAEELIQAHQREVLAAAAYELCKRPWQPNLIKALERQADASVLEGEVGDVVSALERAFRRFADKLGTEQARRIHSAMRRAMPREDAAAARMVSMVAQAELAQVTVKSLSASVTAAAGEAARKNSTEVEKALGSSAPPARFTFSAFGMAGPRRIAMLAPEAPWRPLYGAAIGGVVQVEYCHDGQTLDDWQAILEVCSYPARMAREAPQFQTLTEQKWRALLLDGKLTVFDAAQVVAPARPHCGRLLANFAYLIEGDSLLGDRFEVHEYWATQDRICSVRMTIRDFPIGALPRDASRAVGNLGPSQVDPSPLDAGALEGRSVELAKTLNALLQRLPDSHGGNQAHVIQGFIGLKEAAALAVCAKWHHKLCEAISSSSTDPALWCAASAPLRILRHRLDWTPPEMVAHAVTLEQIVLAIVREHPSPDSRTFLLILDRAIAIHITHGGARSVLRCLRLLNLVSLQGLRDAHDSGILERLLAVRERLTQEPQTWAEIDVELLDLLGKGGWGLKPSQLMELGGRLESEGAWLAREHGLGKVAAAAQAAMIGLTQRLMPRQAVDKFFQRSVLDVLTGGPLCEYRHRPNADAVFLRPIGGGRPGRINHRLPEAEVRKLAAVPGGGCDAETISLEAALAVGTKMSFDSVGGEHDSLGASQMVVPDAVWKRVVRIHLRCRATWKRRVKLPRRCGVLFVVPAVTEGVRWELRAIRRFGLMIDTYFVMLPEESFPDAAGQWIEGRPHWRQDTGFTFPEYCASGGLFRFGPDRKPEAMIPFDDLWNGRFAERLEEELAGRHGLVYSIEWRIDDVLDDSSATVSATDNEVKA